MSGENSWREEMQSAHLYRALADYERGTTHEELFEGLARAAEHQARIWADKLEKNGVDPGEYQPGVRVRLVALLLRRFGPRPLRTVLAALKIRGMSALHLPPVEGHAVPGGPGERRHSAVAGGNNLRAAVFGVNDGLISNASLIMGFAGAEVEPGTVVLAGVAGLLAGAFSMAAGEFVSVTSQRELYEYQIGLEREELAEYPEEEALELALIYQARGVEPAAARELARKIIADPEVALDTLAREELGLDPQALGSPWGAAVFSFVAFAAGASVPLVPLLPGPGHVGILGSAALTGAALLVVGATLSLFTGRSAAVSGLRMLLIGTAAAGLTFAIGHLLGVAAG